MNTNPHCEYHIYSYNGKRFLVPWGDDNTSDAMEIIGDKTLAHTDEEICDITDGECEEVLDCTTCPFASICCWDDLPEELAVDNGWTYPED